MSAVAENLENEPRYKMGYAAGKYDRAEQIESDMWWFKETEFDQKDPAYVAGYDAGYRDTTPIKKKKKKR